MEDIRICSTCGIEKPLSEYPYDKSSGRYKKQCKACKNLRSKIRRDREGKKLPTKVVPVTEKSCSKCGVIKTAAEFNRSKYSTTGLSSSCKVCDRAKTAKWFSGISAETKKQRNDSSRNYYHSNKNTLKYKKKQYKASNLDKFRNYGRNRRGRVAGIPGSHTAEEVAALYISQEGMCCLCGESIAEGYHVDHIIPVTRLEAGPTNYITNLQLTCPLCNITKGNKLPDEYVEYIRLVYPDKYDKYLAHQDYISDYNKQQAVQI